MRVLITGAAGYLGAALVRSLGGDHDLTLVDVRLPEDREPESRWVACDITGLESLRQVVAGHAAVVHTVALVRGRSGQSIDRFADVMVRGTWNVAHACAAEGVSRLVNISSVVAGGRPTGQDRPATAADRFPLAQVDLFYALSKRLGEEIVNSYGEAYPELATLNLRPGVIAGDGANPEPSRPTENGRHWFSYVDVRDMASAVRSSLTKTPAPTGTYAIVAGRADALFDWQSAAGDFGYISEHTWPAL